MLQISHLQAILSKLLTCCAQVNSASYLQWDGKWVVAYELRGECLMWLTEVVVCLLLHCGFNGLLMPIIYHLRDSLLVPSCVSRAMACTRIFTFPTLCNNKQSPCSITYLSFWPNVTRSSMSRTLFTKFPLPSSATDRQTNHTTANQTAESIKRRTCLSK